VFVSKNNGKSWTASSNGLSEKSVYSVLSYMNYLYAGTEKGLFISTDYGANWIQTGNNLPLCRIHNVISKISKKEKKLFAGCAKGVFVSEDDGKTWASINTDAMKHTEVFSVFDNTRYLFAATDEFYMIRSSNDGKKWDAANKGLNGKNKLKKVVGTPLGIIYLAGNLGMCSSLDNGENWSEMNSGLQDIQVVSLIIANGKVFAGTANGNIYFHNELEIPKK
jgi:photosystem II stability/assembly factor-like uncharacterized protein